MSGSDAGPPAPEGGCGCRAARRETLAMSWLALVLVVLATARCRRRALTPKA
jgi:hypothetical protein